MTPDQLKDLIIASSGILLSLIFSYVPGIKDWYEKLEKSYKQLIMLAALLVTSVGMLAATCSGIIAIDGLTCSWTSATELLRAFVLAAIANQTAYRLSPK